jgi:hypothetical protein
VTKYEERLRQAAFWSEFWAWAPIVLGICLASAILLWTFYEFGDFKNLGAPMYGPTRPDGGGNWNNPLRLCGRKSSGNISESPHVAEPLGQLLPLALGLRALLLRFVPSGAIERLAHPLAERAAASRALPSGELAERASKWVLFREAVLGWLLVPAGSRPTSAPCHVVHHRYRDYSVKLFSMQCNFHLDYWDAPKYHSCSSVLRKESGQMVVTREMEVAEKIGATTSALKNHADCPTCGRKRGQFCKYPNGNTANKLHESRLKLIEAEPR